jgi:hypothetical protein
MKKLLVSLLALGIVQGALASSGTTKPASRPQPVTPSVPQMAQVGQITGITYKFNGASNIEITITGINGDAPCHLVIQRNVAGAWDPGFPAAPGFPAYIRKSQGYQFPFTIVYGSGKPPAGTTRFEVKGLAQSDAPACKGTASADYPIPPPPPPDVNT